MNNGVSGENINSPQEPNQDSEMLSLEQMPDTLEEYQAEGVSAQNAKVANAMAEMDDEEAEISFEYLGGQILSADTYRSKERGRDGSLRERSLGEKYAIWQMAKDTANTDLSTLDDKGKKGLSMQFAILNKLWMGDSLESQQAAVVNRLADRSESLLEDDNYSIDNDEMRGDLRNLALLDRTRRGLTERRAEYRQYERSGEK